MSQNGEPKPPAEVQPQSKEAPPPEKPPVPQLITSRSPGSDMAAEYEELLPSKGLLYIDKETGKSLLPGGKVTLRPFTTREESVLYSTVDNLQKIAKMIDLCVLGLPFPKDELLLIDRFYILLSLRIHSFGGVYNFTLRCSSCRNTAPVTIDIARDLDMTYLEDSVQEPFHVDLPDSKKRIGFRLLRGKDERDIASRAKRTRMKSFDTGDPSFIYRLALSMMEVEGIAVNTLQAEQFINNLTMRDSQVYQRAMEKAEGGVDTTIYPDCPACGYTNEMEMPFDIEFFRPSTL